MSTSSCPFLQEPTSKYASAICPHLQRERLLPTSTPPNYDPPFAAHAARFDIAQTGLTFLLIGAQSFSGSLDYDVLDPVLAMVKRGSSQPRHYDVCSSSDAHGYETRVMVAYWSAHEAFSQWRTASGFDAWWLDKAREEENNGWLLELLSPNMDRVESVFSDAEQVEGAAVMATGLSEPILEHAYWGSARDRFPIGQVDMVKGEPLLTPSDETSPARQRPTPKRNLCVIRSGQDWSQMEADERDTYLSDIHPTLIKGMDFLRDHGSEVGCYDCRFMSHLDERTLEPNMCKTFGLAFFDDLASLEAWSKDHPTHLDIFHRFLHYVGQRQGQIALRLYHEVYVLQPEEQSFEYINCRAGTGLGGR